MPWDLARRWRRSMYSIRGSTYTMDVYTPSQHVVPYRGIHANSLRHEEVVSSPDLPELQRPILALSRQLARHKAHARHPPQARPPFLVATATMATPSDPPTALARSSYYPRHPTHALPTAAQSSSASPPDLQTQASSVWPRSGCPTPRHPLCFTRAPHHDTSSTKPFIGPRQGRLKVTDAAVLPNGD